MVTNQQPTRFVEALAPRPKTQTEMKRRIRSLSSSDAALAVEWLNATQGTSSNRSVIAMRAELEELGGMLDRLRQQNRKSWRAESEAELCKRQYADVKFHERHNALNKQLASYVHVPALAYNANSGIWRFGMVPRPPRGPEIKLRDESFDVRVNASTVIAALARLASNRELYKVRLCETCGKKWRVSERKIDRFCSQKCRDEFHTKSPDYRERKAANQRNYRERLKLLQTRGLA